MTVMLCLSCSPDAGVYSFGVQMAPSAWCGFPYHISSISVRSLTQLPHWASNSTGTRTQFNWLVELNWNQNSIQLARRTQLEPELNSTGSSNSTGTRTQFNWLVELNWNQNSIQLARRTQLNYIMVRRPLDLWNRMFNRHQAEITVMQFTGHSLPVHQSMSVPWEFF